MSGFIAGEVVCAPAPVRLRLLWCRLLMEQSAVDLIRRMCAVTPRNVPV